MVKLRIVTIPLAIELGSWLRMIRPPPRHMESPNKGISDGFVTLKVRQFRRVSRFWIWLTSGEGL